MKYRRANRFVTSSLGRALPAVVAIFERAHLKRNYCTARAGIVKHYVVQPLHQVICVLGLKRRVKTRRT